MRGSQSVRENKNNAQKNGASFYIPPFVNYEVLRGLAIKPIVSHEKAYTVICENSTLGEMTVEVWKKAVNIYAELYTKHFTVKDADIIIAAFCMVKDCTLVTNNAKDFININALKIVNWFEE
jgi:predicted nucleic acid-binding protein